MAEQPRRRKPSRRRQSTRSVHSTRSAQHDAYAQRDTDAQRGARPQRGARAQHSAHVQPQLSSVRRGSKSVEFANRRKSNRARQGYIDQVTPETSTRETDAELSRRRSSRGFVGWSRRRSRIKRVLSILIIAVLLLCAAAAAATCAYISTVSGRMGLSDSDAASALTSVSSDEASYTLLVGEFSQAGKDYDGPDTLILARVDQSAEQVALISVPVNTQVTLDDGETCRLADLQLTGGDSSLIEALESLCGVTISHIIKIGNEGLVSLVDELGGLDITITEELDDPRAGSLYLAPGEYTLDGEETLILCRAWNYEGGTSTRSAYQRAVVLALASKITELDAFNSVSLLDTVADALQTDYSVTGALALSDAFADFDFSQVISIELPGSVSESNTDYFILDEDEWELMLEAIEAGGNPTSSDEEDAEELDLASFDITVRNGTTITGAAASMASSLESGGFVVLEIGNANQAVYDETLVVYSDEEFADAAEAVAEYLGVGRVVYSTGYYSYSSDVLVMLGSDWAAAIV